jgi:hypothetical protein
MNARTGLLGLAAGLLTAISFAPAASAQGCSVDQNQPGTTVYMAAFSQTDLAQSFKQTNGTICGAGIFLQPGAGTTDNVRISVWTGLPNAGGVLLAQASTLGTQGTWCDVYWPSQNIVPGATYYLVFDGNSTLGISGEVTNPYPGGQVYANPGYGPFPTFDYSFRTYSGAASGCNLNQNQPSNTVYMAGFGQTDLAQSFKQSSGSICGAGIFLQAGVGTTDNVRISVWTNLPNAAGVKIAEASTLGTQNTWCDVYWPSVNIVAGTTYYLVFDGNTSLGIAGDIANPYPGGQVYANPGYGSFPAFDYTFRTYGSDTQSCSLNQNQPSNAVYMAAFAQTDLAQSFQQSGTSVCGAGIFLQAGVGTTDTVRIGLWTGLPNAGGVLLAQASASGTQNSWVDVFWPTVSVSLGTTYYLVFDGNSTLGIAGDVNNPYPFGQVYANPGYGPFPTFDYTFRTYGGGCATPVTYCVAKTNSLGCVPSISSTGIPSASSSSGFVVRGSNVRNQKAGLLFYGVTGRAAIPFQNGTLCVNPPIKRTPATNSNGSALPTNDCTGVYQIDMNCFAAGSCGGVPLAALTSAGTVVNCQWWGRDPGFAAPNNTTLTNGLEYIVCP